MPYSKNPDKYPAEIQALPEMLKAATQSEYNIPAESEAEARGRKTQMQSYFTAVEARAKEMRQLATRAPAKDGRLTREDAAADALALAELWEGRARTVAGWMIRTPTIGGQPYVQLARRTAGTFGLSLTAAFTQLQPPQAAQQPAPGADPLAEQMALLRQAASQLDGEAG